MAVTTRRVAVVGAGMIGLCTAWFLRQRGVEVLPVNTQSLPALDHLAAHGVSAPVHETGPFITAYERVADVQVLLDEFEQIEHAGGSVEHELVGGPRHAAASRRSPRRSRRATATASASRPSTCPPASSTRLPAWRSRRWVSGCEPLVGRTESARVFVVGCHGMWGITLGLVTGRLLAEQITTAEVPAGRTPFDPLRRLTWSRLRRTRGRCVTP